MRGGKQWTKDRGNVRTKTSGGGGCRNKRLLATDVIILCYLICDNEIKKNN